MQISGYSFNVGNFDFDMTHDQALNLFKYLDGNRVFGIETIYVKNDKHNDINFSIRTNICLDGETTFLDLDLIELKDLYYILKKLFETEKVSRG